MGDEGAERRQFPRVPVSIPAKVGAWPRPAEIVDLSPGGAKLKTVGEPEQGPRGMVFTLGQQSYRVTFVVVHWLKRGIEHFWGCRFTDMDGVQRDGVAKTLEGLGPGQ